ncbi:zinc finger MYM-type protein 1-like [Anoplophora glabripennis]|uniref:zinc finger MYM-type protein 1-like n=1 Tax=Anoplophora glabripennis TaxID=217634 RepID=UPI0008758A6D|nr:zinc finger MYM-type protein 1-like [Anoplophora glabripennis]
MCVDSLNELLEKPFKCFTKEEQLEIVRKGRFTDLTNLSHSDKGKKRTFWTTWYQKVTWLSGNTVNKKLYCWNCILFPSGSNRTWNKMGFDDLRNLSQATKKHEESREHIYATVKLRLLCKKGQKKTESVEDHGKKIEVKRNREYLERLIDIAGTLARVGVPLRGGEDEEDLYGSMVHLMKKYDDVVRTQLEQGHSFHGLTSTIQIGLIQSMEQAIHQRIAEEVSRATFFSLMVGEMNSDIQFKRISVSIRYVTNGVPVERFIGLFEVNHGAKAEEVAAILDTALDRFNYKEKMITQSYDGRVVKATELYSLQQNVKSRQHPHCQAQLVHYYALDFGVVLSQALSSVQECKLFFSVIALFCKFFQDLNFQPDKKLFESIPTCVANLKTQYEPLLRLLEYITTDEQYENALTRVAAAVNLINHMKNFRFLIFVTMFAKFFSLIGEFINRIQGRILNAKECRREVNSLIKNLKIYKVNSDFNYLIRNAVQAPSADISASTIANMFALNVQILDNLIHEIEGRFLDIELGDFFVLVGVENFALDAAQTKPLDSALLLSIRENYPKFFDTTKLRSDLDLLYGDPSIGGFGERNINQIKDILKFVHDNDIRDNVPELYKLLELVVTVPSYAEPLEGMLCVLNRINSYCGSQKKEEPRSGLAVLAIERDLLLEMGKNTQWYSQVIDHFAKLPTTSSIELLYKNTSDEHSIPKPKAEMIWEPELEIKSEPDTF